MSQVAAFATGDAFRRTLGRARRSEGQAILEFVLVLPLILVLLFALVQMAFDLNRYIKVTDAARVAARAAAVYRFGLYPNDPCAAARAALPADVSPASVSCSGSSTAGSSFTVTVTATQDDGNLPFVGNALANVVPRTSSATERIE